MYQMGIPDYIYSGILHISLIVFSIVLYWNLVYFTLKKRAFKRVRSDYKPKVSVIIPAYNEEKVIGNTLKKLLSSNYPKEKLEVLVVNDGSTDKTEKIVKSFKKVRLINLKKNRGKSKALNEGIKRAKGEVVIITDADTEFGKNTIAKLVRHFKDEKVGAVAGYTKVKGNGNKFKKALKDLIHFRFKEFSYYLLEKLQSLEYLMFLYSRKRQEIFSAVLVVPGAIGAFKKKLLEKIGGFDPRMLLEDHDMTIRVHKAGYKIKCEKDAIAWTIPPQTWKELWKQRMRWNIGGIQVLRKHLDMLSNRVGLVTFVFSFEYINFFLQFALFSLIFSGFIYKIMIEHNWNFYAFLSTWIQNLFAFEFGIFDLLLLIGLLLFILGFIEAWVSVRLCRDSLKILLLYPLLGIYSTLLGYNWIFSFFSYIFGRKFALKGSKWKGRK